MSVLTKYEPQKTVQKMTPAGIVPVIGELLPVIFPGKVDRATSYAIGAGVFAVFLGLKNWLKNRKRGP
jgi:hypothetical protein